MYRGVYLCKLTLTESTELRTLIQYQENNTSRICGINVMEVTSMCTEEFICAN